MHSEDPVLFLIPKHMFWAERESAKPIRAVPFGRARKHQSGSDVTVIAWGNTVEKSLEAIEKIGDEASIELFDLRSIAPWDKAAVEESVRKTGRVVIVQEDTGNCSVGQMIISHLTAQADIWDAMVSPPTLVTKSNVMIGYNPIYEYAALPDVERIVSAIRNSVSITRQRQTGVVAAVPAAKSETSGRHARPYTESDQRTQKIVVPIMGEGIRAAKVVSLLKKPGDKIQHDDPLCEVETDKAVYPIESSFAGTMGEWKTEVGANVEIGEELGTILVEGEEGALEDQIEHAAEVSSDHQPNGAGDLAPTASAAETKRVKSPSPSRKGDGIEPALSPTITRRLSRVISANLQIDARWDAIRKARDSAKKKNGKNAPSPSVMLAWAVVRAMEKHAPFRRLMLEDDQIVENDDFDLGVAVALEDDRLATAVVTHANKRDWPDFVRAVQRDR